MVALGTGSRGCQDGKFISALLSQWLYRKQWGSVDKGDRRLWKEWKP